MQTVVITGVGKGIGKALAEKFIAEGYRVLGTTVSGECIDGVETYQLDLSDPESVVRAASEISVATNAIDILINNAGVLLDEEETSVDPALLQKTLAVNLVGTVLFTEALKALIVRSGGHIVHISSTAGSLTLTDGSPRSHHPRHYPAYKISKAAINMYTRTLAIELKGKATVSSVHPGWTKTDMGGEEADLTPEAAAEGIFFTVTLRPETGQFWYRGERLPW